MKVLNIFQQGIFLSILLASRTAEHIVFARVPSPDAVETDMNSKHFSALSSFGEGRPAVDL
jgi:hypothetical protein